MTVLLVSDEDECRRSPSPCSQGCDNLPGSYLCTCNSGFVLTADLTTCQGESHQVMKLLRCCHVNIDHLSVQSVSSLVESIQLFLEHLMANAEHIRPGESITNSYQSIHFLSHPLCGVHHWWAMCLLPQTG